MTDPDKQRIIDDAYRALERLNHVAQLLITAPELDELKTTAKYTHKLTLLILAETTNAALRILDPYVTRNDGADNNPLRHLRTTAHNSAVLTLSPERILDDAGPLIKQLAEESCVMSAHPTTPMPPINLDLQSIVLQTLAGRASYWFRWADIVSCHAALLAPPLANPDHDWYESAYHYVASGLQDLIHHKKPPAAK